MYWTRKSISWLDLANFAVPLGDAAVSEAATERGFSAQGIIFRKLRSLLSEDSTEAATWLNMNHCKVMEPNKYANAKQKRAEKTAKKRTQYEANINALLAKRAKAA